MGSDEAWETLRRRWVDGDESVDTKEAELSLMCGWVARTIDDGELRWTGRDMSALSPREPMPDMLYDAAYADIVLRAHWPEFYADRS